jgi:hypothetical protein
MIERKTLVQTAEAATGTEDDSVVPLFLCAIFLKKCAGGQKQATREKEGGTMYFHMRISAHGPIERGHFNI